jgi:hypothetical protein
MPKKNQPQETPKPADAEKKPWSINGIFRKGQQTSSQRGNAGDASKNTVQKEKGKQKAEEMVRGIPSTESRRRES